MILGVIPPSYKGNFDVPHKKYIEGIRKTGFELEFQISSILQENGWIVINNKYYIDDVKGAAREIDIVAYRAKESDECLIYTVLLISCKKSEEKIWALLSREKNPKDPNTNWHPIRMWSNDPILKYMIKNWNWQDEYINSNRNLFKNIFEPTNHIFAFQELSVKNGSPQNDKAIFNSVVSLMKSQWYETNLLDIRKHEKSIYNFNLISVIDTKLLRINFEKDQITSQDIDSEIYIANYIINKKETSARIHFLTSDSFHNNLQFYNALHEHNKIHIPKMYHRYYEGALTDDRKTVFLKEFNTRLLWRINFCLKWDLKIEAKVSKLGLCLNSTTNILDIDLDIDEKYIEQINSCSEITEKVSSTLNELYRYKGEFIFTPSVPF